MNELAMRTVTGAALAIAAAVAVLWSPPAVFAALTFAVFAAGLWEWRRLGGFSARLTAVVMLAFAVAAAALFQVAHGLVLPVICLAGVGFWGVQAVGLWRESRAADAALYVQCTVYTAAALLLSAYAALLLIRTQFGAATALAALAIVWSADTFAYLVGKKLGTRKLAPAISAGKTLEGVGGGIAGAGVVGAATAGWLDFTPAETLRWVAVAMLAALAGVVGDLYESRLKRRAGVKDSGAFLPGHGGVLDRVDGLLAAAPIFAAGWWLFA